MSDETRYFRVLGKASNIELVFPITPFPRFSASVEPITQKIFGIGEIDVGFTRNLIKCTCEGILPSHQTPVSYTHLTLPTKRIV